MPRQLTFLRFALDIPKLHFAVIPTTSNNFSVRAKSFGTEWIERYMTTMLFDFAA
jgi:hypothetical protein